MPSSGNLECANQAEEAATTPETEHVVSIGSETDVQHNPPVSGYQESANQAEEAATPETTEDDADIGSEIVGQQNLAVSGDRKCVDLDKDKDIAAYSELAATTQVVVVAERIPPSSDDRRSPMLATEKAKPASRTKLASKLASCHCSLL